MTTIDTVLVDVIQRDAPLIQVTDERRTLGGPATHGVLRIRTSDGAEGQCIIGAVGDHFNGVIDDIIHRVGPMLVGADPDDRQWLWSRLDALTGHGFPFHHSWSWVDIALWDLAGKRVAQPIFRLLGRSRAHITVIATYPPRHTSSEGFIEEALEVVDRGYTKYKVHPGSLPISETVSLVRELRHGVGATVDLVLDANNRYHLDEAMNVGRAIDDAGFAWYEDPIPSSQHRALQQLVLHLRTPVAVGDEALILLREAALHVAVNKLRLIRGSSRKLGITGMMKLCSYLEAEGLRCELGTGGNPSANAANLHVGLAAPNAGNYEHWLPSSAHEFAALGYLTPTSDGHLIASEEPGLGVPLDEAWIDHHRVSTLRTDA